MESGPSLQALTRRLAECPPDFFLPSGDGAKGTVHFAAVVADLLRDLGAETVDSGFGSDALFSANAQTLVLVASWLLHDEWFRSARRFAPAARAWLAGGLIDLATVVRADRFVGDADRREELARLALAALGLVPEGEAQAQAADRMTALSSVERKRVLNATREAHEHTKRVREAMKKKEAEEAAARYTRE